MNQIKFVIDAKTVVKWFGMISLTVVTIQTVLMYIDVLPQYDGYLIVWLLVLMGFGHFFK